MEGSKVTGTGVTYLHGKLLIERVLRSPFFCQQQLIKKNFASANDQNRKKANNLNETAAPSPVPTTMETHENLSN